MPTPLKNIGSWLTGAQSVLTAIAAIWATIYGVSTALSYLDSNESRITRLEQFQEAAGASIRSIETISDNVRRLDQSVAEQAILIREIAASVAKTSGQIEGIRDQINANRKR